jgi:hypothetical protein
VDGDDGENFSPVIFLYGMAIVLAVGKAFTLWIWRTLPKPRPPLRQEVMEAWQRRKARVQAAKTAGRKPQSSPAIVEEAPSDTSAGGGDPRQIVPPPSADEKDAL